MRLFTLTKKKPIRVYRYSSGYYSEGRWVEGSYFPLTVQANVQPAQYHEVIQMDEADRTKKWCNIFSESELRTKKEGPSGYGADRFYWQDDLYEVRKSQKWDMGILDHYHAMAVRIELTPEEIPYPED